MFNLNAIKALKNKVQPVKAVASNGFLDVLSDMKDVETTKTQVLKKENNYEDNYNSMYQEALELFRDAVDETDNNNILNKLEEAAGLFAELINIKKTKAEPYFYLSYIFFVLKDITLAIKYFKVASFINPDLEGLESLKSNIDYYINNSISQEREINKEVTKLPNISSGSQPYKKPILKR